jgi:ribosomal protein S18 acetylase RimI-like enzyme
VVARLLDAFNRECDDPTPGEGVLAPRVRELMGGDDAEFLLAGDDDGVALLRFRQSVWTGKLDAYLEELYVVPEKRGRGLGRGLLEACMALARERGAARMDLGTSESDVAAIGLYESAGFTCLEKGSPMRFYERELDP